jgi:hypothetical protein
MRPRDPLPPGNSAFEAREVTAGAETLMRQAGMTADEYLHAALRNLDEVCGKGRALDHPNIVGAMIIAAALDYHSAQLNLVGQFVREGLEAIADAIRGGRALSSAVPQPLKETPRA